MGRVREFHATWERSLSQVQYEWDHGAMRQEEEDTWEDLPDSLCWPRWALSTSSWRLADVVVSAAAADSSSAPIFLDLWLSTHRADVCVATVRVAAWKEMKIEKSQRKITTHKLFFGRRKRMRKKSEFSFLSRVRDDYFITCQVISCSLM